MRSRAHRSCRSASRRSSRCRPSTATAVGAPSSSSRPTTSRAAAAGATVATGRGSGRPRACAVLPSCRVKLQRWWSHAAAAPRVRPLLVSGGEPRASALRLCPNAPPAEVLDPPQTQFPLLRPMLTHLAPPPCRRGAVRETGPTLRQRRRGRRRAASRRSKWQCTYATECAGPELEPRPRPCSRQAGGAWLSPCRWHSAHVHAHVRIGWRASPRGPPAEERVACSIFTRSMRARAASGRGAAPDGGPPRALRARRGLPAAAREVARLPRGCARSPRTATIPRCAASPPPCALPRRSCRSRCSTPRRLPALRRLSATRGLKPRPNTKSRMGVLLNPSSSPPVSTQRRRRRARRGQQRLRAAHGHARARLDHRRASRSRHPLAPHFSHAGSAASAAPPSPAPPPSPPRCACACRRAAASPRPRPPRRRRPPRRPTCVPRRSASASRSGAAARRATAASDE